MKEYKEINGTSYDKRTPEEVVKVLEQCRKDGTRIVLDYGNTTTGESWGEVYDITGTIGRSAGNTKIPILLHNARSIGGGAILDHCIISIKESKGKRILYQLKLKQ